MAEELRQPVLGNALHNYEQHGPGYCSAKKNMPGCVIVGKASERVDLITALVTLLRCQFGSPIKGFMYPWR